MAMFEKEMRHAVEFIPNRLYYVALSSNPPANIGNRHFFSIDNEMVYWNFYLDFGPLNLGHVYRYCMLVNQKLNDAKLQDRVIYHYSHTHAHKRTNAAFLICSWFLLFQGRTPEEAFRPFKSYIAPFPPWHDATPSPCTFNLTILDTLKGLHKARELKFFDLQKFDIEEYEFYEQVENGDLNWYVDGKFLAFAGPHAERQFSPGGYHTHRPEDYVNYFKRKNVTLVVRLNKPYYDAKKFMNHGIDHVDMYFLDGSNPPDHILTKFIAKCEETPGAVAVHCKAGLGRTGTCIAAYIMKHFKLTAEEIIGWMRIVRPGSVIGPQQQFLKEIQSRMWRDGDLMRSRPGSALLASSLPTVAAAKDDSSDSKDNNRTPVHRPSSGSSGMNSGNPTLPYAPTTPQSSVGSTSKRFSKLSISNTTPTASAPSPTTPVSKLSAASPHTSSSQYPSSTGAKSIGASPLDVKQSPAYLSAQANSSSQKSHSSYISPSVGSSRPSSRGATRPSATDSTTKEEGDKEGSQGDLLRLRRQQHLQNSAVYSLTSTSTPPKNRLSFGFTSTEASSTKVTYNSNGHSTSGVDSPQADLNRGNGSNTPNSANRPRSRLGGFLSAWNK